VLRGLKDASPWRKHEASFKPRPTQIGVAVQTSASVFAAEGPIADQSAIVLPNAELLASQHKLYLRNERFLEAGSVSCAKREMLRFWIDQYASFIRSGRTRRG
jgi:hypothetical protein